MDQHRILIVEDDEDIVETVKYSLELRGYNIDVAYDGLHALRKAHRNEYDLMLLDIMLPGIDGYDICEQVRMNPETEKIPIIMTSGKTLQDDKDIGMRMGASVYLTKPVPPSEMLSNVKALLGEE